jgi:signal transduction histidine kinase
VFAFGNVAGSFMKAIFAFHRQPVGHWPPPTTVLQRRQTRMSESGPASPSDNQRAEERTLRLEMALRRSEKLAMAGRFAASVMHEINNPSQAIADLVYLIGKDADHPERVRAHAVQIEEQLVRIQYIARQTLSFFRDAPRSQTKDLVPLVETALRYQSALLEEKRIKVQKELPDILVASVYPGDFLQLVSNFVRNAAEALPSGGALCIRLRASGANARLTVADNGRGIPLPIQARLFEAFQSDKAEAGNGLGLWICKTIVDKHRGSIRWRSSIEGKTQGTTFSVLLPLDEPTETDRFGERSYIAR